MAKLQNPNHSVLINEETLLNNIKQNTKSDTLTNYLSNLNLKKSGKKQDKIQRLIDHFQSHSQNLEEMNEISLKSYCNLFDISVTDNPSKTELISNLCSLTANNNDTSNSESIETTVMESDIDTNEAFGFQMDQEREEKILLQKMETEQKLIEIDEKQSFLHKSPIDTCTKVTFANDSEILFETSRIGHLSESAIIVNCKGNILLTTATSKLQQELKFEDALDLKVDAHERSWPRGYIPSGMQRNDGGITDYEILLCRMIDRSIRPLFILDETDSENKILPAFEVQILSNLLSCDDVYDTQVLAINGASAAVYCSPNIDIGNNGPIGAVRVIIDKNDEMICNPTRVEMEDSETKCNVLYVGTSDNCVMIETDANLVDQEMYINLLKFAQKNVSEITNAIQKLKQLKNAKNSDINNAPTLKDEDIRNKYSKLSEYKSKLLNEDVIQHKQTQLFELYSNSNLSKNERNLQRDILRKEMTNNLCSNFDNGYDCTETESESILTQSEWTEFYKALFYEIDHRQFRNAYITNNKRCDGRAFNEVRGLSHMIDILPSCHGSALFQRGDTQTLCSATLGPPRLARMRDLHKPNHPELKQRLYFQYEMPPASTNEIKPIQSKNRRAIGHGNIALHALQPLLPSFEEFPYSIRIFSNITSSDGSSSMASVCGGSLALMDAGVPLHDTCAGISIGLIDDILLTDICGIEDHFGDMDFKIAGTKNGITSVQLDIKKGNGICMDIICNAVRESTHARLGILENMNETIDKSNSELKLHAPRVEIISVSFRDLPRVIGSGGAVKQKIQIETKCDINIHWEEECVEITAPNINALNHAKRAISDVIGSQCRIGDIITAKIINIQSYGVMIEIEDGSEHLVHISQWIDNVSDNIGQYSNDQSVDIMCIGFLGENRPNFSRKAAVWQLSDDPEDRARLRLMLDSLRPPARSRGAVTNVGGSNGESVSVSDREPLSIFSDSFDTIVNSDSGNDMLSFEGDFSGDDNEEDSDTHPTILPPKSDYMNGLNGSDINTGLRGNNNTDSIKNLIESISTTSASVKNGSESGTQSRFASLYKGIKEGSETGSENGSKFSDLMSGVSNVHSERQSGLDKSENNKNSIEHWKNFTNDLISSNANEIEKDSDGDDLLTDLFGDKHKPSEETSENNKISSRASKLMEDIPELIQDLNANEENGKEEVKEEQKWPWQE